LLPPLPADLLLTHLHLLLLLLRLGAQGQADHPSCCVGDAAKGLAGPLLLLLLLLLRGRAVLLLLLLLQAWGRAPAPAHPSCTSGPRCCAGE
jgi:hypothetical protein